LAEIWGDAVANLITRGIAGDVSPSSDYFILKRRVTT
jgi:hypothetical protein